MKLIVIGVLVMSLFGCGNTEAKYQKKFLNHIQNNAPEPYKECLVDYIKSNWQEAWETFNREKVREPRGETDIVNFMIEKYLPICKQKLDSR